MRFAVEVITIGGGLPYFLGTSCSGNAFSAAVVSESMSVVLSGEKRCEFSLLWLGILTAAAFWEGCSLLPDSL
jgi:hypothetical protein